MSLSEQQLVNCDTVDSGRTGELSFQSDMSGRLNASGGLQSARDMEVEEGCWQFNPQFLFSTWLILSVVRCLSHQCTQC